MKKTKKISDFLKSFSFIFNSFLTSDEIDNLIFNVLQTSVLDLHQFSNQEIYQHQSFSETNLSNDQSNTSDIFSQLNFDLTSKEGDFSGNSRLETNESMSSTQELKSKNKLSPDFFSIAEIEQNQPNNNNNNNNDGSIQNFIQIENSKNPIFLFNKIKSTGKFFRINQTNAKTIVDNTKMELILPISFDCLQTHFNKVMEKYMPKKNEIQEKKVLKTNSSSRDFDEQEYFYYKLIEKLNRYFSFPLKFYKIILEKNSSDFELKKQQFWHLFEKTKNNEMFITTLFWFCGEMLLKFHDLLYLNLSFFCKNCDDSIQILSNLSQFLKDVLFFYNCKNKFKKDFNTFNFDQIEKVLDFYQKACQIFKTCESLKQKYKNFPIRINFFLKKNLIIFQKTQLDFFKYGEILKKEENN